MSTGKQFFNYLSVENGVKVMDCSSAGKGSSPDNVLTSNRKNLWLSETGFPQYLTFDLTGMVQRPKLFRCFGVDCWHDYQSNPKTIEIQVSPNGQKFIAWKTVHLEMVSGTQLFEIDPIPVCYGFLKVVIMESFGEEKCYINQLFLLADHPQGRSRSESGEIGSIADGYKSPNERMSKEGNRASQDAIGGSGRKSQPMFDEYLARELKAVREELEEVKGHNLALQAKVEYLEDSVEQKQDKIAHLSSLLTSLATQLKDMVVQEVNQSKLTLNKEMKQKFDELERNIQRKLSQQNSPEFNGRNVLREFTLGHPHGSEGKDEKNSDSSLRDKQKGLEDMMSQLKETIALRQLKFMQLRNLSGGDQIGDY